MDLMVVNLAASSKVDAVASLIEVFEGHGFGVKSGHEHSLET